jgi:hypothetical protein
MKRLTTVKHLFVDEVPESLQPGTLYISVSFSTAIHRCCCGCGQEVVTPITPTDWKFIFDGATVSLEPSIGNWSLPCQSHYWIRRDKVIWAPRWSKQRIEEARRKEDISRRRYVKTSGRRDRSSGGTAAPNDPSS